MSCQISFIKGYYQMPGWILQVEGFAGKAYYAGVERAGDVIDGNDDAGALYGAVGALDSYLFDGIVGVADACRID